MLAYIFWHYPREETNVATYESHLTALHEGLRNAAMREFRGSRSFRVAGLPWINSASKAYEDWYLLDGWAVLDGLNAAAVGGERKAPHDRAAATAAGGAGGIYRLRAGADAMMGDTSAQWFSKPEGMPYAALDDILRPLLRTGCALWQRQMVLGPGLEFCLIGPEPVTFPDSINAIAVKRFKIQPSTQTP